MQHKSIKRNTAYNAIKTCAGIIFPLITFPYISRVLKPENVGKVSFATSFVSYFSLIATLGITTYAVRECSAVKNDTKTLSSVASQIYSINIITTSISYILLITTLFIFRQLDYYRELIVISSTAMLFIALGADWLNTAMEDFKYITIRTVAFQVLSLLAMFLFVKCEKDYVKYAIITVAASSGANLSNVIYRRRFCDVGFTKQINWKKHLKPIMLLFAMLLSQQILANIDITMIGLMRSDAEVGLYSTATKIYNITAQVVHSILFVLLPRFSEYYHEGKTDEYNELLRKALLFLVGLGFPCAAGLFICSDDIVLIIAGNAYSAAAKVLRILMIEFVVVIFGGGLIGNLILIPMNREDCFLKACVVAAIVNIVFNAILIPRFGINGAAFTTAVSSIVELIVLLFYVDKSIKIKKIFPIVMPPCIGCCGIIAVAEIIRSFNMIYWKEFFVILICGVITYFSILLLGNDYRDIFKNTIKAMIRGNK